MTIFQSGAAAVLWNDCPVFEPPSTSRPRSKRRVVSPALGGCEPLPAPSLRQVVARLAARGSRLSDQEFAECLAALVRPGVSAQASGVVASVLLWLDGKAGDEVMETIPGSPWGVALRRLLENVA